MDTAAEPASSSKPYFFVLQSGLITSALALAGVYWLNKNTTDFNIMGWYANYVLPVGAVIVGFVAGSGYGLASWFTGVRISRWLLATVLLLQAISYVAAEYVEFRDVRARLEDRGMVMKRTGRLPSFFEYYDFKARNFSWKSERSGETNEPLGAGGYFFVLLGAIGFIASGLLAPTILMAVPYCDDCQRYMTKKVLGIVPASISERKIRKSDHQAQEVYAAERAKAFATGDEILLRLRDAASTANLESFRQELAACGNRKANSKLPRRVEIGLIWCKLCEKGHILPTVEEGHGKQMRQIKLEKLDVSPQFVRGINETP